MAYRRRGRFRRRRRPFRARLRRKKRVRGLRIGFRM